MVILFQCSLKLARHSLTVYVHSVARRAYTQGRLQGGSGRNLAQGE